VFAVEPVEEEDPVVEAPVEVPVVEAPVEDPVVDAPEEAPVVEAPVEDPVVEAEHSKVVETQAPVASQRLTTLGQCSPNWQLLHT